MISLVLGELSSSITKDGIVKLYLKLEDRFAEKVADEIIKSKNEESTNV